MGGGQPHGPGISSGASENLGAGPGRRWWRFGGVSRVVVAPALSITTMMNHFQIRSTVLKLTSTGEHKRFIISNHHYQQK